MVKANGKAVSLLVSPIGSRGITVYLRVLDGTRFRGTGFLIGVDPLMALTCWHVIARSPADRNSPPLHDIRVELVFPNGDLPEWGRFAPEEISVPFASSRIDIAVLVFSRSGLPALETLSLSSVERPQGTFSGEGLPDEGIALAELAGQFQDREPQLVRFEWGVSPVVRTTLANYGVNWGGASGSPLWIGRRQEQAPVVALHNGALAATGGAYQHYAVPVAGLRAELEKMPLREGDPAWLVSLRAALGIHVARAGSSASTLAIVVVGLLGLQSPLLVTLQATDPAVLGGVVGHSPELFLYPFLLALFCWPIVWEALRSSYPRLVPTCLVLLTGLGVSLPLAGVDPGVWQPNFADSPECLTAMSAACRIECGTASAADLELVQEVLSTSSGQNLFRRCLQVQLLLALFPMAVALTLLVLGSVARWFENTRVLGRLRLEPWSAYLLLCCAASSSLFLPAARLHYAEIAALTNAPLAVSHLRATGGTVVMTVIGLGLSGLLSRPIWWRRKGYLAVWTTLLVGSIASTVLFSYYPQFAWPVLGAQLNTAGVISWVICAAVMAGGLHVYVADLRPKALIGRR